jgi:hypothetical protein
MTNTTPEECSTCVEMLARIQWESGSGRVVDIREPSVSDWCAEHRLSSADREAWYAAARVARQKEAAVEAEGKAAYPLIMFYRLRRYSPNTNGIFAGYELDADSVWRKRRLASLESYVAARPDLFQMVSQRRGTEVSMIVDTEAPLPTLAELATELSDEAASYSLVGISSGVATMELLATCLVKGNQEGSYGNSYWSNEAETIHLLSCGFDWTKFRGVNLGRWAEWNGTFAEDSNVDVLEARMVCRCDDEEEVAFGMELPSLADLIVTLSAGQLEKLFRDR